MDQSTRNGALRVVVVGNGMVGHRFVDLARDQPGVAITVFCEEPRPAYDRVHLSEYFNGRGADELALDADAYAGNVALHVGEGVASVDLAARTVRTSGGAEVVYDALVLATGSYPFVPPIAGNDRAHCHVYRTIEDLERIAASGADSSTGVVVGGGLLGLEAANALRNMGLETHVVEFAPGLMTTQLDEGGGAMLRGMIEDLGVVVHTDRSTLRIVDGEDRRHRLEFADGETLETDLVVFSAGIRPRDELARACGLEVGPRGGIVIDEARRTSDPNVYAIGECALFDGRIFGLLGPGYEMAKVAAGAIAGDAPAFRGADMSTQLKLLGVDVGSIGGARLRHLQTCRGLDPGRLLERLHPERQPRPAAGHQRSLSCEHAEERHVFHRAARTGRRDHGRQADRARTGREEVRPVHQDHRRPAHRPVRCAGPRTAGDLA